MKQGRRETLSVRVISSAFTILALAIFKPFGLETWQWQAWIHLLMLFVLGVICCMVTEAVLKYIVRKPRSTERGVSYIIHRNLWFQFINTPLVALTICLYRHYVLSDRVEGNLLSWSNFLETLAIIAFLSFAIGLYWRFKYRSRFLAAELEETRLLNEQLQKMQQSEEKLQQSEKSEKQDAALVEDQHQEHSPLNLAGNITLTGNTNETVTLDITQLLYVETVGNYVKVYYLRDGQVRNDMLRATSKQIEDELQHYAMIVRCHRAFLVNLVQVDQIISKAGSMQLLIKHSHESIPVSRSNMAQVKEAIKAM